jgi:hypothetical protein
MSHRRLFDPAAPFIHVTSMDGSALADLRADANGTLVDGRPVRVCELDGARMATHAQAAEEMVRGWNLAVIGPIGWAGVEDLLQAVEEPTGRVTIVTNAGAMGVEQEGVLGAFVDMADFIGRTWQEDFQPGSHEPFPHPPLPFHTVLLDSDLGRLEGRIASEAPGVAFDFV